MVVRVGDTPVRLKVNPRARRVSIRVSADGAATATAPSRRALSQALAFAQSRAGWLADQTAKAPEARPFQPGQVVEIEGRSVTLIQGTGQAAARLISPDLISAGGDAEGFNRRVIALLKREAKARLEAATERHAARLGLPRPAVGLGDPRGRWGSCSPHRNSIRYSWRLILAPPQVLDYVAAHEVGHLIHADHSPAFWAVVARLDPEWKAHRAWLRREGARLHALGRG